MRLSQFISNNIEPILQEWEDFAKTLYVTPHPLSRRELRDHAREMIKVIALDLATPQTEQTGIEKSQGRAPAAIEDTAAEIHAVDRLASGFTIEQLMAEYRALRSNVLRLWAKESLGDTRSAMEDMTRFNEAIDQALTESVARYSTTLREYQNLFLAILGHDVRTPLGTISMGAEILMMTESLPSVALKTASRIMNSTKRVNEIVRDLLDFSTSQLGDGIPISPKPMNAGQVCAEVIDEVRSLYSLNEIKIHMSGDLEVMWDQARFSQAFANLVTNAIQHGAPGEDVCVNVSGGEVIKVEVKNSGEAISPTVLRTIFDPAKRFSLRSAADRASRGTNNLGLGLYIARQIISAHEGKIIITSNALDGTTFTLEIPRRCNSS